MKPPFRSIRIAGKRHSVHWNADLDGDCGLIEYMPLKISIGAGMAADEARESLLHEVIHGIAYQGGLKVKEKTVRQLSIGLYEVLKNNPKLVSYLLEEDEDGHSPD